MHARVSSRPWCARVAPFLALLVLSRALSAADFAQGVSAYKHADFAGALAIFNDSAARGDARAQYALGLMYEHGEGIAADPQRAFDWYSHSAEQGYPKAQYQLGVMYMTGRGVVRDDRQARQWFARAAEAGDKDAVNRYRQFAEDGDVEAQYNLAVMYLRGSGVASDPVAAARWMQRAAARGHLGAMFAYGRLYELGRGLTRSYTEAANWYDRAAAQGDGRAAFNLAGLYRLGLGVPRDLARAEHYYAQALSRGYTPAGLTLAMLYEAGLDGWPRDRTRAADWYRQVAERGDSNAQINLGYLYAEGEGVEQDLETAYAWFYTADQLAHPLASDNLALITAQLDEAGVAAGQALGLHLLGQVQARLNGRSSP
jgi:TPR repeat protein